MFMTAGWAESDVAGVQQLPGKEAEVRRAKAVLVVQRRESELRISRHSSAKVSADRVGGSV
jgi:hypothetical protein